MKNLSAKSLWIYETDDWVPWEKLEKEELRWAADESVWSRIYWLMRDAYDIKLVCMTDGTWLCKHYDIINSLLIQQYLHVSNLKLRVCIVFFLHNLQKFCILRVSVATCLRCDGKYCMSCWKLAFCSMLKEFWKSIRMWQSSRQSSAANFSSAILFGPLCICIFISVFVCVCVCVNVVSWDHLSYSGDL